MTTQPTSSTSTSAAAAASSLSSSSSASSSSLRILAQSTIDAPATQTDATSGAQASRPLPVAFVKWRENLESALAEEFDALRSQIEQRKNEEIQQLSEEQAKKFREMQKEFSELKILFNSTQGAADALIRVPDIIQRLRNQFLKQRSFEHWKRRKQRREFSQILLNASRHSTTGKRQKKIIRHLCYWRTAKNFKVSQRLVADAQKISQNARADADAAYETQISELTALVDEKDAKIIDIQSQCVKIEQGMKTAFLRALSILHTEGSSTLRAAFDATLAEELLPSHPLTLSGNDNLFPKSLATSRALAEGNAMVQEPQNPEYFKSDQHPMRISDLKEKQNPCSMFLPDVNCISPGHPQDTRKASRAPPKKIFAVKHEPLNADDETMHKKGSRLHQLDSSKNLEKSKNKKPSKVHVK